MLLCYITDRLQFSGDSGQQKVRLLEKIAECVAAGVDYIQLREKDLNARDLEALATGAMRLLPPGRKTKLLVNSRTDVALACGAHGVHLPANDIPASDVRAIFARAGVIDTVIGTSSHSTEEVSYAEAHGADFALFGPVFDKSGERFADGLQRLKKACARPRVSTPMPVLALGGVTVENTCLCVQAGAAGVAGIRLFQENVVEQVVRSLAAE